MQTIKIVVAGPYQAGKSAFIASVCLSDQTSSPVNGKRESTSALDLGRFLLDEDTVVNLYAAPGQKRFAYLWKILAQGMHGLILVVDSTAPETFLEAREILAELRALAGVPVLVAAGKRDLENAWPLDDLRAALHLAPEDQLQECVAKDRESALAALHQLLMRIPLVEGAQPG